MHKELELRVVVNGTEVKVEIGFEEPLFKIVGLALNKSGNAGQSPENWLLKDAQGNVIDVSKTPKELHLNEHSVLFLSLKAGVGGIA